MIILFVRHGETDNNLLGLQATVGNDEPINPNGKQQAELAAKICIKYQVRAIFSSPLKRCIQTAEAISSSINLPIGIKPGLIEFDMGDRANLKSEESMDLLKRNNAWDFSPEKYSFRVPGGVSWEDVAARASKLLAEITKDFKDNDAVVLVSHNATIRAAVGIMRELPFEKWFGYPFSNGGVSAFDYDGQAYKELFINKTT